MWFLVSELRSHILLLLVCCLVAKSCPTLCNPMDCSPPVSSVHGISQVRLLEWVAISFSRQSSQPRDQTHVSCILDGFSTTESPKKPKIPHGMGQLSPQARTIEPKHCNERSCNAEDPGLIPEWGRSPGEGNGSPLQYSCLGNAMDGGAW